MSDEYTPGELARNLARIDEALRALQKQVISPEMYQNDRQVVLEKISALERDVDKMRDQAEAARVREDDAKARQRLTWIGLIAGPFVGAFALWIIQGGLA